MQNLDILFDIFEGKNGAIGHITLNRPNALNALTEDMCIKMYEQLYTWEKDPHIKAILIQGAGEKAFCSGGDVRNVYYQHEKNKLEKNSFFKNEYHLNAFIHHYSKPYIAIMHGITFGGGAGVSVHGKYRIATDTLKFSMPETGIGFFPDIGGSYFLSRCKGKTGLYLGLTGNIIDPSDTIYIGLADYHISTQDIPNLISSVKNIDWKKENEHNLLKEVFHQFHIPPSDPTLPTHIELINLCFSADSIEKILVNLEKQDSDWAKKTYDGLLSRCPTSLKVTLECLKRGSSLDFDACMEMEYKITSQFLRGDNFYEGVRAALIDKDRNPQWKPKKLSEVSVEDVLAYFR